MDGLDAGKCVVPVMAAAWMLSLVGGVAQGGFVFAAEALIPKVERLSPAQKLGQMFSLTGLSGLLKSLLPFAAIVYIGFATIRDHWIADRPRLQHQLLDLLPFPARGHLRGRVEVGVGPAGLGGGGLLPDLAEDRKATCA